MDGHQFGKIVETDPARFQIDVKLMDLGTLRYPAFSLIETSNL